MKRKIEGWLTVQIAKNPGRVVLATILLFNIVFFFIAALIISNLSLSGTERMGFLQAAFCTITMILDAGCIQFVIEDIGHAGVAVALICLCIVIVGMISFTGAVIGYITNYISHFIENANAGSNVLKISDHVVILNWNTRASEIINDLLYNTTKEKVVVLVASGKKEIEKEINERLSDTIMRENQAIWNRIMTENGYFGRSGTYYKERFTRNVTVLVKEGDVFSSKQLHDISIEQAKTVIILGNDNYLAPDDSHNNAIDNSAGNPLTVKTLMQVADITSSKYSKDNQKIIVEITDDWTWDLVDKIKRNKQVDEKCNIVPVRVNRVLGQILSQFSLMPELNLAYRELFSNKGATFYSEISDNISDDEIFISNYLKNHKHSLPLTMMSSQGFIHSYYSANSEKDIKKKSSIKASNYEVKMNHNYWIERKKVVILGHNSKSKDIMRGFSAFRNEWNYQDKHDEILKIIIIDDPEHLEEENWYKEYPFVIVTVGANIYDRDLICATIDKFVSDGDEDTSVLILSDDEAPTDNIDANALASLVYVQDIINSKKLEDPDFDEESIDVIVEIIDPKHHDIVSSYSVNNVVISNRYISKMITQIGEKEALFDFYTDILTYDTGDEGHYESKEIYIKKVSALFDEIPAPCTADELVRSVYKSSISQGNKVKNPTIVLGYVKPGGKMNLFEGDQSLIEVQLEPKDKLIVFSNH